jgi:hypothetical protein
VRVDSPESDRIRRTRPSQAPSARKVEQGQCAETRSVPTPSCRRDDHLYSESEVQLSWRAFSQSRATLIYPWCQPVNDVLEHPPPAMLETHRRAASLTRSRSHTHRANTLPMRTNSCDVCGRPSVTPAAQTSCKEYHEEDVRVNGERVVRRRGIDGDMELSPLGSPSSHVKEPSVSRPWECNEPGPDQ